MLLTPAKPTNLCNTGIKGTGSIDDELSKIIECMQKTPYLQLAVLPDKKKKMITWLELTQLVSEQDFQQKGNSSEDDFSADAYKSPKLLSPEEEQPKKRSLLEIAQWAKEQNFQWKSSPKTAQDLDDLFVEAYESARLLPDEEEEEQPKKRSLLEIAQWAKEQNFHWKSGPNAALHHNDLFVEAYKEAKLLSDSDEETGDETTPVEREIEDRKEVS